MVFLFYVSHDENDISGSLARHEAKTREDILEVVSKLRIVVNAELLPCTDCGTDIITELLNCFANILLKNYSTTKSETESRSK